jgi:hypothetical protein
MIDHKFLKIVKNELSLGAGRGGGCYGADRVFHQVSVKATQRLQQKHLYNLNIIGPIPSVVLQLSIFLLLENKSLRPSVYI